MKTTDDELIRQLRAELDELASAARVEPGNPPEPQPGLNSQGAGHDRRWVAIGIAAASVAALVGGLIVVADRDAGGATSDTSPPTSPTVPATAPTTAAITVPDTAAPDTTAPETAPPTTAPAPAQPPAEYEVIAPVLETAERGTQLCLGQWMIAATPPLCDGPELQGWSWDAVGGGNTVTSGTWAEAYVAGAWDPTSLVFTVTEARAPTAADHARFAADIPKPDFSVPCPEPAGGWPARNQEWPEEQIHMIPGYAGSWEDPTHQVVTVRFTGDLEAAEAAVRQYYDDALCVVPAQHSMDELVGISNQLLSMSSVKFLWSQVYSDATGEWVEAGVIVPDPERQAAFDEQYGEGVVRLTSRLRPL
jgi:hypothetical protein